MRTVWHRTLLACILVVPWLPPCDTSALAQETGTREAKPGTTTTTTANDPGSDFWKTFGIGLGLTVNLGSERSIQEAQLVNGIVRVTSERQVTPRLMLEKHWYLHDGWTSWGTRFAGFVGVNLLGEKQIMDAVAVGVLVGFKPRADSIRAKTAPSITVHHLGLGIAVQPYSRTLGDGLDRNAPLPAGETSIRYKETNRVALLFFYTYQL